MINKLPTVYVARQLNRKNGFHNETLAYFVSKAYLTKEIIEYDIDGTANKTYEVIFDDKKLNNLINAYNIEYKINATTKIFHNYSACKIYVAKLNNRLYAHRYIRYSQNEILKDYHFAKLLEFDSKDLDISKQAEPPKPNPPGKLKLQTYNDSMIPGKEIEVKTN